MGGVHYCRSSLGPDGTQVDLDFGNIHNRNVSPRSREGLPLTMKSCFYPLIGDRIFGWPGDLIDILRLIFDDNEKMKVGRL